MKLYNNFAGDVGDPPGDRRDRPRSAGRQDNDVLRFDVMDDDLEEHESVYGESIDSEVDLENVDVQAILFYGHTGRRCFPSLKAL